MKTNKQFLYLAFASIFMLACGNKKEVAEQESGLIEITNQQFETESMQLGKIETRSFENIVNCNGIIVPLPNGMAKVNAPLNGMIKNINCFNGESVERNQPLIEITGNEIIEIQKEFAEAAAHYKRLKSEYERIKSLFIEKVTAEKDYIIAESEYKASMAKYSGLKLKIEAIGLSTSKIENGEFYSSFFIKSPIKGYISNLNASIGSYVDSQNELLEIVNPDMLQLKLAVFANEITNVRKGQKVRFKPASSDNYQFATISSIGVTIDNETKSIPCFANFSDGKPEVFISNSYIEATIIISVDTVKVVPNSAIIKGNDKNNVLVLKKRDKDKYVFKKQPVRIGKEFKDYVEIITDSIDGMILTKGTYYIEGK